MSSPDEGAVLSDQFAGFEARASVPAPVQIRVAASAPEIPANKISDISKPETQTLISDTMSTPRDLTEQN
jgi:hypothetical protein